MHVAEGVAGNSVVAITARLAWQQLALALNGHGCLPRSWKVKQLTAPVHTFICSLQLGVYALLFPQVFQDALDVDNFTKSDEAFAADALFMAYQAGEAASIQKVIQVWASNSSYNCHQASQSVHKLMGFFG